MFIPGNRALGCYQEARTRTWDDGYEVSEVLEVPPGPHPESKIWGCSICIPFQQQQPLVIVDGDLISYRHRAFDIVARNITRELSWEFTPPSIAVAGGYFMYGIHSEGEWVSVWHSHTFFEPGDQICVGVNMGTCVEVKGVGIKFLYGKEGDNKPPKENQELSFHDETTINETTISMEDDDQLQVEPSLTTWICFSVPAAHQTDTYRDVDLHNLEYP